MENAHYIEFTAPCCASIRECSIRKHIVVLINPPKVLRKIEAVRCYRGATKKYKFYPSDNVVLAEYYVSNRGNLHIRILWKPEGVTEAQAEEAVKRATSWWQEEILT